ncbi:MAG: methylthioribulose 1-phosphate dehydratase [Sulfuricaulis sp.]|uniref:methylthioribulose 1-phosphate dehydratase n=1 Tax=Sulfuricaulis sp. TaxID=2003553 RepID=UPI0034A1B007
MAQTLDDLPPRAALVEIAHDFHARGWMAGTAGNLSARDDDAHFWITASGKPKGRLDENDFLRVRVHDGAVIETRHTGDKPSAETSIHAVIYRLFPQARACLHGHIVESCLAAERAKKSAKSLRLPPLEMIKGFDIWEQNPKVDLPLFKNHLDVAKIAKEIETRFKKARPALTALLVRGHGPTVWGASLQEAYNRFETLEFILRYLSHPHRR